MTEVRVNFGVFEDARRVVFCELTGLPSRQQSKLAHAVVSQLRNAGLLPGCVDQHYSATQTAALLGRSPEFVVKEISRGKLRPVYRDGGGWLVPASSIQRWLDERTFSAAKSSSLIKKGMGAEGKKFGSKSSGSRLGGADRAVRPGDSPTACTDGTTARPATQDADYECVACHVVADDVVDDRTRAPGERGVGGGSGAGASSESINGSA